MSKKVRPSSCYLIATLWIIIKNKYLTSPKNMYTRQSAENVNGRLVETDLQMVATLMRKKQSREGHWRLTKRTSFQEMGQGISDTNHQTLATLASTMPNMSMLDLHYTSSNKTFYLCVYNTGYTNLENIVNINMLNLALNMEHAVVYVW